MLSDKQYKEVFSVTPEEMEKFREEIKKARDRIEAGGVAPLIWSIGTGWDDSSTRQP